MPIKGDESLKSDIKRPFYQNLADLLQEDQKNIFVLKFVEKSNTEASNFCVWSYWSIANLIIIIIAKSVTPIAFYFKLNQMVGGDERNFRRSCLFQNDKEFYLLSFFHVKK